MFGTWSIPRFGPVCLVANVVESTTSEIEREETVQWRTRMIQRAASRTNAYRMRNGCDRA